MPGDMVRTNALNTARLVELCRLLGNLYSDLSPSPFSNGPSKSPLDPSLPGHGFVAFTGQDGRFLEQMAAHDGTHWLYRLGDDSVETIQPWSGGGAPGKRHPQTSLVQDRPS